MKARVWLGWAGAGIAAIALVGGGIYLWTRPPAGPMARPVPPPAEVGVIELAAAEIPLPLQYAGRVAGFRVVEIRAQVSGILLSREYNEGDTVQVGQVLFRIDPRPYQAALDKASAQVAQAQAAIIQTDENFLRVQGLTKSQVATQKSLEDATAARDQARASLQTARAEFDTAKLNLDYTTVKAPIAGPTSLLSPTEGALVQAQQSLLTTITRIDPAYVNFTTTDTEFRSLQALNKARAKPIDADDIGVQLQFGDGTTYPQLGTLDTRSRIVDPKTGTIQIRAIFPNEDAIAANKDRSVFPSRDSGLLPGQFVRINLLGITMANAILIPKAAISQGPQGAFVYVVDANSVAQARYIKLDRELDNGWIVREGLKPGERIVVDGIIRVRPGSKVRPVAAVAAPADARQPAAPAPAAGAKP